MFISSVERTKDKSFNKEGDEKALKLYLEAVDLGATDGFNAIGDILWRGNVEGASKEKAITWYRRNAELGSPYSQYKLAIALLAYDKKKYLVESINLLRTSYAHQVEQSKAPLILALNEHGLLLCKENKDEEALAYLIEAADLGCKEHLFFISCLIENYKLKGKKQENAVDNIKDPKELVVWKIQPIKISERKWQQRWYDSLTTAANLNDKNAQTRLGYFYEYGGGYGEHLFEKDIYKAVDWYRKANRNGDKRAGVWFLEVAKTAAKNYFEQKEYHEAFKLCKEILALEKDTQTCHIMGRIYRDGHVVGTNIGIAKDYFSASHKGKEIAWIIGSGIVLLIVLFCTVLFNGLISKGSLNDLLILNFLPILVGFIIGGDLIKECEEKGIKGFPSYGLFTHWLSFHESLDVKWKNSMGPKLGGVFYGLILLAIPFGVLFGIHKHFHLESLVPTYIDWNIWMYEYMQLSIPVVVLAHFVYPFHSNFIKMVGIEITLLLTISLLGTICGNLLHNIFI